MHRLLRTIPVAALLLLAFAPGATQARDGGGDRPQVLAPGACGHGARSWLRLRGRDSAIAMDFEVDENRAGRRWKIVVVHERRVAWRGWGRTHAPSGSFSLEQRVADWPGPDQVMVRAVGPRGITCQATATLPG